MEWKRWGMYTKCEHDRAYMPSSKSDISEYVFFSLFLLVLLTTL